MVQASAKGDGELNSSHTVLCQSWKHIAWSGIRVLVRASAAVASLV
jgi:hypothetical protein